MDGERSLPRARAIADELTSRQVKLAQRQRRDLDDDLAGSRIRLGELAEPRVRAVVVEYPARTRRVAAEDAASPQRGPASHVVSAARAGRLRSC